MDTVLLFLFIQKKYLNRKMFDNTKLMDEVGKEEWLKLMPDNLKGNYV